MSRPIICLVTFLGLAGYQSLAVAQDDRTPEQIQEDVRSLFEQWLEAPESASSGATPFINRNGSRLAQIETTRWQEGTLDFTPPDQLHWKVAPKDPKAVTQQTKDSIEAELKELLIAAVDEQLSQDTAIEQHKVAIKQKAKVELLVEVIEDDPDPPDPPETTEEVIVCYPYRHGCLGRRRRCCCVAVVDCLPVSCCAESEQQSPAQSDEDADEKSVLRTVSISAKDILAHLTGATGTQLVSIKSPLRGSPIEIEMARHFYTVGYHAYWSADYKGALENLDRAVETHQGDARFWYYKGLAEIGLGQIENAERSFSRAVELHAQRPSDSVIARSLQRVQGRLRVELQLALTLFGRRPLGDDEGGPLLAAKQK